MQKRVLPLILATAASVSSANLYAQSFSSFDPRSMAMGGTGVAVSRPDTASFFNPSLLSLPREDDNFSLQIPYIGAKFYDPDDFEDDLDTAQDAVDALDATIAAIDAAASYTANDFNNLASDTTNVNNALISMDETLLHFEVGGGIAGGLPGEELGIGAYVNGRLMGSGIVNYEDSQTLDDLAQDATILANCISAPPSCLNTLGDLTYITVSAGTITNPINLSVNFDTDTDLTSTADLRGILVSEVGISLSHSFDSFSLGITPKYISIETFDYQATVENADTDDFDGDDYIESYSDFNIDLGISSKLKENVIIGLVVKNIIEQEYETVQKDLLTPSEYKNRGGDMVLSPQARVGIAYQTAWALVAADLDLTKNKAIGYEEDSQQLAVGAEFDALNVLQLRLGYKLDFEDSDRSTASAGLGVAFLGAHVDLAIAGNGDEIGGAMELGFSF